MKVLCLFQHVYSSVSAMCTWAEKGFISEVLQWWQMLISKIKEKDCRSWEEVKIQGILTCYPWSFKKKNHPQVEPLLATYTNRFHFSWFAGKILIWSTLVMQRSHIPRKDTYLQLVGVVLLLNGWSNSLSWVMPCFNFCCRLEKEICPNYLILADIVVR